MFVKFAVVFDYYKYHFLYSVEMAAYQMTIDEMTHCHKSATF